MLSIDFNKFRRSAEDISGTIRRTQQEIQKLEQELDSLNNDPLHVDDMIELANDYISKVSNLYPDYLVEGLRRFSVRPLDKKTKQLEISAKTLCGSPAVAFRVLDPQIAGHAEYSKRTLIASLLYTFRDEIRKSVEKALRESWKGSNMTVKQRHKRIKEINQELEKLRANEAELQAIASQTANNLTANSRPLRKGEKV